MIRVGMLWGEGSLKFHLLSSNETSVEYSSRGLSFSGGDGRGCLSFSTGFKIICNFEKKTLEIHGPKSLYL